jgi:hypothetical protein
MISLIKDLRARIIIIIIQSSEKMKNAFARRNILSKNAHTSFRSIERKDEKKIRKLETKCENKFAIDRWFTEQLIR